MSNGLEGTWTVESSGGLTECLFPLQTKLVIQASDDDPLRLDVILVDGDRQLLMGNVDRQGVGAVTLRLQTRVLDPVQGILLLNTSADEVSGVLEEAPVGTWTAEEGGNVEDDG